VTPAPLLVGGWVVNSAVSQGCQTFLEKKSQTMSKKSHTG